MKCFSANGRYAVGGLLLAAAMLTAGCAWTAKQTDGAGIQMTLTLDRDKYVILDTVKGHGKVTYYFAFIQSSDGQFGFVRGQSAWQWNNAEAAAVFQALNQAKGADALLPLTTEVTGHGFPYIYWVEEADVSAKALRLKTDKELNLGADKNPGAKSDKDLKH
ncbi:MAG: hypothetical protein NTX50_06715 [Candidatus Sumerlaeota bacterium]|nr:hypothetical protein [Candidatus Sumerlaeota bacterium]